MGPRGFLQFNFEILSNLFIRELGVVVSLQHAKYSFPLFLSSPIVGSALVGVGAGRLPRSPGRHSPALQRHLVERRFRSQNMEENLFRSSQKIRFRSF